MNFTKAESERLFGPKLNKNNVRKDGRFIARIKINKPGSPTKYKTGKGFKTIEECNAEQERMLACKKL